MAYSLDEIYRTPTEAPTSIGRGACLKYRGVPVLYVVAGTARSVELIALPSMGIRTSVHAPTPGSLDRGTLQALLSPVGPMWEYWTYVGQADDVLYCRTLDPHGSGLYHVGPL